MTYVDVEGFTPFWAVTKYNDILEIERQADKFVNEPLFSVSRLADIEAIRALTGSHLLLKMVINMDHAEHRAYRFLTQSWFSPQNIKQIEPKVAALAGRAIDAMISGGSECDFVRDVAGWYPLRVIMSILGLPEEDEEMMRRLTQELFGNTDPELQRGAGLDGVLASVEEFTAYFNAITEDRRANPRTDVASIIANASIDGAPIGHMEAMSYYILLATAGHDTTTASLAGGLRALALHKEEARKLQQDPALLPSAIDEILRWESPVKHFMRTATVDYELGGQTIRNGDHLMMCYPSGNFDEEVFADPWTFKIDRTPNRHIAFGYGAHLCLGQHLAKMELRSFFKALLDKIDLESLEVTGNVAYVENPIVSGLKRLPIRYRTLAESLETT